MTTSGAAPGGAGARLAWMDTMRGIAVLLVVLTHAVHVGPVPAPPALLVVDRITTPFRVPALMFLSGMLLPRSLAKPRGVYLRGKVSRILWPYLLWSLVILAVTSFGAPGPNPLVELFWRPSSSMWYLGYLFLYYLAVLLVPPAGRTWLLVPTLVGLVAAAPSVALDPLAPPHSDLLQKLFFCFVCFLCGDLLTRNAARWLPVLMDVRTAAAAGLLALPALVMSVAGHEVRFQPLYLVSTLAGIMATIPLLTRLSATAVGRSAASLGRSSIVFFTTHFPAQLVAWHLALAVGLTGGLGVTGAKLVAGLGAGCAMVWLRSHVPVVDHLFDLHLERWTARRRERARTGPGASATVPRPART